MRAKHLSVGPPAGIEDATLPATWDAMHRDLAFGAPLPPQLRNIAMSGWATVAGARNRGGCGSGGSTDTVASITGAIVGARSGRAALPPRWLNGFVGRELIEDAVDRLTVFYG